MARTGHTSVGTRTRTRLGAAMTCMLAAALVLTTGSAASAAATATVSGPVTGGHGVPVAVTTQFDLATVGYQQSEFFLSGTANAYRPTAALGDDGRWSVTPSSQAPFTTRMIVNRPADPRKFNGTVVVEWLNVSIGADVGVDWGFGHNELIRRGYAWVGVSAQTIGLNATKAADPVRYASLTHPGDSYSYDMFTQAGEAIRHDAATVLGGLRPKRLLADGESQSASRMVTYIDAIQPLAHAFDGFLVHSRGSGGAPLSQAPLPSVVTPPAVMIRTDNTAPVIVLQSETDVNQGARQDDSRTYRLWEMAGTSHVDAYTVGIGLTDDGDGTADRALFDAMQHPPGLGCAVPINTGPSYLIVQSAFRRLDRWVRFGIRPPKAKRLEVTSFSPTTYARDANGNVFGGIRTPEVDTPVATITNAGQSGAGLLCRLVGTTTPFSAAKLASLYKDHEQFVRRWRQATNAAVAKGFVLPPDARKVLAAARASSIPG